MGGRGSGSGLKKESMFKPISLSEKTGTDKQKKYAQDLLDSMRNTALANGTAGYYPYKDTTMQRYVSKDFAESMQQAYRVMKVAVDNRKTYGEVIDVLKRQDFLKYAESLRNQAKHKGVSVKKYVDDLMEAAKKKRKS